MVGCDAKRSVRNATVYNCYVAEQNVINKNFVWEQADQSNLIRIYDTDDDLIAEYSRISGAVRWKRAASAVDKNVIERFLAAQFGEEVRSG